MSRRYRLTRSALDNLDAKLKNYRDIENTINRRKYEIENDKKVYENIGGGRANKISKPVEDIVIKWFEDSQLQSLYAFKNAVERTIADLNDENMKIFTMRWLDPNQLTWREICETLHWGKSTVYRRREIILELFDKHSGELG